MTIKKILIFFSLITISNIAKSQFELATGGGLCSSIPFSKRDTFSGSQSFTFAVLPKYRLNDNFILNSSIKHLPLKISRKSDASEILWQSFSIGLGCEYSFGVKSKMSAFFIFNSGYLYKFGKNVLSQSSPSGTSFIELKPLNRLLKNVETGFYYQPKEFITMKGSVSIPFLIKNEIYKPPANIELSLYYRFIFSEKKPKSDKKTILPEKEFCKNLRNGKLYIIVNRKDSSYMVLRKAFAKNYNFSEVDFIDNAILSAKLDSFKKSENFKNIFIAKVGTIVYDVGRAATNGIIIYDYQMQNPVDDKPFFIRNLTHDTDFESIDNASRIVKKLNSRLYKHCNDYKF